MRFSFRPNFFPVEVGVMGPLEIPQGPSAVHLNRSRIASDLSARTVRIVQAFDTLAARPFAQELCDYHNKEPKRLKERG